MLKFNPLTSELDLVGPGLAALDDRYVNVDGDTMEGRLDFPSTPYDITNPAIRFTQVDSSSTDDHAKGLLLEWGGNMSTGVNYPYGIATNAYIANPSATFTVPTTGYKKWGWIMTHYQSPASTGETVHQHLNFETVKADFLTVITRLQISFGEDIALVSFPNSHVKVFNDKNFQIGTDATGTFIKHDTAAAQIVVTSPANTSWNYKDIIVLLKSTAAGGVAIQSGVTGESVNRFQVNTSGRLDWGSGSATRDTNLYRSAADTLKTDDSFVVDSTISAKAGASTGQIAKVGGTIFSYNTDAGNSTTTETDLYTDTIPANTLSTNKDKLEARYAGEMVNSATATRQLRVYFGGTAIFDTGTLSLSAASDWDIDVFIIRVSSSVVRYSVKLNLTGASLSAYANVGELTGLTLSNANTLKITGQAAGVGAVTNDIVGRLGTVDWKPAP